MNSKLRKIIEEDIHRYYGSPKIPINKRIFPDIELKYIITYRKVNYYNKRSLRYIINYFILKRMQYKYAIQIPKDVKIGKGFYIGHLGRIIINGKVIIGDNVNLSTGVVIGQENRGKRKGTPRIGNKVWIGANAVIVGKINIGNNVLIAPNSYVNFDVPNNSIVVGNPGKIIHREDACDEYIKNIV